MTQRVYGTPGASLLTAKDMDPRLRDLGIEGEQRSAATLEAWVNSHGGYLFHSVKFPGEDFDADHAILIGDLLILIDDKMWQGGKQYSFITADHGANVTRDGETFAGGKIHSAWQTKSWEREFRGLKVVELLNIASRSSVHIFTPKKGLGNLFVTQTSQLEQALTTVHHRFSPRSSDPDKVNRTYLSKLSMLATWARGATPAVAPNEKTVESKKTLEALQGHKVFLRILFGAAIVAGLLTWLKPGGVILPATILILSLLTQSRLRNANNVSFVDKKPFLGKARRLIWASGILTVLNGIFFLIG